MAGQNDFLIQKYNIKSPKIALCALNPHAGENGMLGKEETDIFEIAEAFLQFFVGNPQAVTNSDTQSIVEDVEGFVVSNGKTEAIAVKAAAVRKFNIFSHELNFFFRMEK